MDGTCTTADAMTDQPEMTPTTPEDSTSIGPEALGSRKPASNGRSRKNGSSQKRRKSSSRAKKETAAAQATEIDAVAETSETMDLQNAAIEGDCSAGTEAEDMPRTAETVQAEAETVEDSSGASSDAAEEETVSSEPASELNGEAADEDDRLAADPIDEASEDATDAADIAGDTPDASEEITPESSDSTDDTEPEQTEETAYTTSSAANTDIEIHPHRVTEAILFCTDSPLPAPKIAKILGVGTAKDVKKHIGQLNKEYADWGMSFRIEEVAGGFQMLTIPAYNTWLSRVVKTRQETKLSPAAMETLSIVAYKQPCTRADVEAIRGVAAGDMLNRLREMNLVKIVGRAEDLGRPLLYGTTRRFLEVFGLPSLEDLPMIEGVFAPPPAAAESAEEVTAETAADAPADTDLQAVAEDLQPADANSLAETDVAIEDAAEEPVELLHEPQTTAQDEDTADVAAPEMTDEEALAEQDTPANVQEVPVASVEAWPDAPSDEPAPKSDAPPHLAIVGTDDDDEDEDESDNEDEDGDEEVDDNEHIVERPHIEDAPGTTSETPPRPE